MTALADALESSLPTLIPLVIDGIISLAMAIIDNLDVIIDAGIKIIMAVADGLLEALPQLIDKIPIIIDKLINAITQNLPKIIRAGIELTLKLAQGIIDAVPQLVEQLPQIIASIVSGLLECIPELIACGGDLLKGLFEGLLNPKNIWENVKKVGKSILDGFKKVFKINSPSKVFRDQIGKSLIEGIEVGFEGDVDDATQSMAKSFENAMPSLDIDVPQLENVGSVGVAMQGQGTIAQLISSLARGGNVVNNYNIANRFEKMETTQLALHKANLELKRIIGG